MSYAVFERIDLLQRYETALRAAWNPTRELSVNQRIIWKWGNDPPLDKLARSSSSNLISLRGLYITISHESRKKRKKVDHSKYSASSDIRYWDVFSRNRKSCFGKGGLRIRRNRDLSSWNKIERALDLIGRTNYSTEENKTQPQKGFTYIGRACRASASRFAAR